MPCHMGDEPWDPVETERRRRGQLERYERERLLKAEGDLVTRLLCGFMRWVHEHGKTLDGAFGRAYGESCSTEETESYEAAEAALAHLLAQPELRDWWERHKALDASEGR